MAGSITRPFARRTERLEDIVRHLGLALGGRPGSSMARRLLLPVSKDTLLRVVLRRAAAPQGTPQVIGIDVWAWRRGHRYGTLICDLERRKVVDLLPDREPATVATWLAARPEDDLLIDSTGIKAEGKASGMRASRRAEATSVAQDPPSGSTSKR